MSLTTPAPFPHSPGSSSASSSRSPSPIPPSSDSGSSSTRPPLQSKSAAFFNASWSFQGSGSSSGDAATLNGPYRSSNAAAVPSPSASSSSSTSLLVPPSPLLGRRASDSCLPPPCCAPVVSAQRSPVPVPTPGPSYSSRGRLASTGNIFASTSTNPWSTSLHQQPLVPPPSILTTLPDRSRSCEPSLSSPTSSSARPAPPYASTSAGRVQPERQSSGTTCETARDASARPGCTSSAQSSDIERRLEAAVRHLLESEEESAAGAGPGSSTSALDTSEDDDMYYNNSADAASTLRSASGSPFPDAGSPFIPTHPLAVLELTYHPRHRTFDVTSLKRALRAIAVAQRNIDNARHAPPTQARRRRQVGFADCVDVVDAFAAVDYPGRRGPPPIERLTMRDVLELREVKIELGVFHANQPPSSLTSSTNGSEDGKSGEPSPIDAEDIMAHRPFEKMNIVETTPMSPSSELPAMDFRSPFIPFDLQDGYEAPVSGKDASSVEESADELEVPDKPLRTAEVGGALTSAASSYESSTPSSISLSASTSASSYYASSTSSPACSADGSSLSGTPTTKTTGHNAIGSAPSTPSNRILLDPHSSHLTWEIRHSQQQQQHSSGDRDTSPESVSVSSISSPSLSLSCSPSASESDCYGYEEASTTDDGENGRDGLDEAESEATYPSGDGEEENKDGRISREKTPTRACYHDGQLGTRRPDSSASPSELSSRRTKNADYFRIPLPVLPPSTTTIHASRRLEVDDVPLDRP